MNVSTILIRKVNIAESLFTAVTSAAVSPTVVAAVANLAAKLVSQIPLALSDFGK